MMVASGSGGDCLISSERARARLQSLQPGLPVPCDTLTRGCRSFCTVLVLNVIVLTVSFPFSCIFGLWGALWGFALSSIVSRQRCALPAVLPEQKRGGYYVQCEVERVGGSLSAAYSFSRRCPDGGRPHTPLYPSRVSGRKAAKRSLGSHGQRGGGGRARGVTTFTTRSALRWPRSTAPSTAHSLGTLRLRCSDGCWTGDNWYCRAVRVRFILVLLYYLR